MAIASIYRRVLPSPPAIEFASSQGKQLFAEALHGGTVACFFKLISYYQTQSEPAYCGLSSLSMVLNALGIDPKRNWKGPWRWFDDSMLDCCEPLEKIKEKGISFGKVACLAHCNGANIETFRTNQASVDDFRRHVISCTSSEDSFLIASYHRKAFKQTGSGHFSPIGGYHAGNDMVLILDVARFKYPPHWVPLTLLWEAMNTLDETTGHHRGFMIVSRDKGASSILYTMSCKVDGWTSTVKYLTQGAPLLLTEDVKDVETLFSVIFNSAPTGVRDFIKWIAEVRRQDDRDIILSEEGSQMLAIKEAILNQVRETKLYTYMSRWLISESSKQNCVTYSASKDTLSEITAEACCLGTKLLNGNSSDCKDFGKADVNFLKSGDSEKPVTAVSGGVNDDGNGKGIDILVPFSQSKAGGLCDAEMDRCICMPPRTGDAFTVLIFSLPESTWSNVKDEELRGQMRSLVSVDNLPSLLQEEVLHLRRRVHFSVTDLNLPSPP
ncbi:hypothetical protein K2173_013711 [Erythroxylum novogranatense]|uniref:glutathione gamma-glutamylcysteinyltransferase n=1 Tax=Erythroxylum novogranatense TaxID=1862640 RepID=A0AAV8SAK1_9ROSI|nr:hypothetical protein K2173_013711 [Erythroxylum novogranatense]